MKAVTDEHQRMRNIAHRARPAGQTAFTPKDQSAPLEQWEPCMRRMKLKRCCACHELKPSCEYPDRSSYLGRSPYKCWTCRTPAPRIQACDHCGDNYTPPRTDSRYCSGRCRVAAHRARAQK